MRLPLSTYRLQINPDFDLFKAADISDYLHDLGADWLYLSPLLKAEPGSEHGYDVVDHRSVDPARGGPDGLDAVSAAAHNRGMGVLIDIVPNHMGVATPSANHWWWDLLMHGKNSRYADAFDVDWDFGGGKVLIPILGDTHSAARGVAPEPSNPAESRPATELDALRIVDGELHYHDNRYPLAPGSADDGADPVTVHSRQNYELVNWRRADSDLNYRRFFAINTLAAIRVENPWVFDESHAEIIRWVSTGLADGLRVDHPDGLADPGGYLDRLAAATDGCYVLVEKILEGDERLPTSWATAGTTGYDALADIDRVLVDPAGRAALEAVDSRLRGGQTPVWSELIHDTKRAIADGILRSEVLRIERDAGREWCADAIAELLACFPVYRSYLPLGAENLQRAAVLAKQHAPELSEAIDGLLPILSDPEHPAAIRFQQTSGMVMAKGVEDTAFYRFTRLGSLTEVGADPAEFSIGVAEFHHRQQLRQAGFPASLTTLSTHDTKRGEDVRARISVLAEIPEEWEATLDSLRATAELGDGPLEALLWEAVIGAWPASRERLHAYATKAAREAGNSTRWDDPDEGFEARMHALIDSAFDDPRVRELLATILERITLAGWCNSLSAKLIQLTAPGVPDVYQGSELWETSLVDPDNRRAVDFDLRRLYLAAIDAGELPAVDETGAAKLLVTSRALRLRRDHPEFFSRYAPLPAFGQAAEHAVAFDRGDAVTVATRLPLGLAAKGGWLDSFILLAGRPVVDLLTGRVFPGGRVQLADLLAVYPVALLVPVALLDRTMPSREAAQPVDADIDSPADTEDAEFVSPVPT